MSDPVDIDAIEEFWRDEAVSALPYHARKNIRELCAEVLRERSAHEETRRGVTKLQERNADLAEKWQQAESALEQARRELAEAREALVLTGSGVQMIADALEKRCRKDQPHDHATLRQLWLLYGAIDKALAPTRPASEPAKPSEGNRT